MGNVNAIPVVSQVKSAVQAIAGDSKGARETQEQFSKQCPGVSQTRSLVEATYDTKAARRTQEEFGRNMESVADSTPIVGHIKGGVHYALGDTEQGDECMKAASRTTAVIAVAAATGGAGLAVAAAASATAGLVADGVTTGIDSAVNGEYRPNGLLLQGQNAVDNKDAGEWFDLAATPAMDGMAAVGAVKAGKAAAKAKQTVNRVNDVTKAAERMPEGTVVTKMYGREGNVTTGVNSKTRQTLMRQQFELGKKTAKDLSKDMPMPLHDIHPDPPAPRNGGACAEHHAFNKLHRVGDAPSETYTASNRGGSSKPTERCDNCRAYGDSMGNVMTDSKHPKLAAFKKAGGTAAKTAPLILTDNTTSSYGDKGTSK